MGGPGRDSREGLKETGRSCKKMEGPPLAGREGSDTRQREGGKIWRGKGYHKTREC